MLQPRYDARALGDRIGGSHVQGMRHASQCLEGILIQKRLKIFAAKARSLDALSVVNLHLKSGVLSLV